MLPSFDPYKAISWQFSLFSAGSIKRFGISGSTLYSQYLPNSVVDNTNHPPRPVNRKAFDLAYRQYQQLTHSK
jgi:hypothetical protein